MFADQYIRIVAFRDGEVVGDDEMLADHAYDVPTSNEAINRMFRNTIYWNWEVDSEEALLKSGDSIGVYRASVVTAAPGMVQFFAEGVAHCLFQPILEWCEGKLAEASNKQTRWRYGTIKKKVVEYMDKYRDGCPESVVYQIADELQLDIVIDMPFAEESTFINAKSQKKRLRVFKFLNTRWDHVEVNELTNLDEKETIVVTRDQMMETVEQLDEAGTFYTFSKDKKGISVVRTLRNVYRIHSEFSQSVTEFEVQTGLIKLKIDAVSDEAMSNSPAARARGDVCDHISV